MTLNRKWQKVKIIRYRARFTNSLHQHPLLPSQNYYQDLLKKNVHHKVVDRVIYAADHNHNHNIILVVIQLHNIIDHINAVLVSIRDFF